MADKKDKTVDLGHAPAAPEKQNTFWGARL
jgi:hypothetical protein